ncbi:MAG: thioredoxin domain-containing protein [Clostridia bacterium]|nr:thioredoxin domain-containing protein [Clostridia bacterium]
MSEHKYNNKLLQEKSPYLLQHAHNPVDWYPWGPETFSRAAAEDKPIFLSIGYSTCHWCHVMERECFEDEEVAEVLNKYFISIKVDREERPDVDHIYMTVCQALTGHGGWPLTIFMTPEKKPFYAGTYFPKNRRMGMPGLMAVLDSVHKAWTSDKSELIHSGNRIASAITETFTDTLDEIPSEELIHEAFQDFKNDFDSVYGGFGDAPKFPTAHNLSFLLRYWYKTKSAPALDMVEKTLDSMHRGGIYDHIGFGFSRYSTDRKWLVPHFEKMLYDNALLAIAYLETFHATRKEKYAETARQIFTYVLRDMTSPEGGFYSAEDADSEGEEGKFYVWSLDEVKQVLGDPDGERFCQYYNITPEGNFEGFSIPNLIKNSIPDEDREFINSSREKLFDYREKRVHPYKDDKILTAWNGLMIAAMAIGSKILGDKQYRQAAERAVDFIFSKLVRNDGRLMARYRDGEAAYPGYVDDYAFLIWGLIELYEATYKPEYLQKALRLNDDLIRYFWDEDNGGLFIYGSDSEQLIMRPKEIYDGATPSGNSVSALNFLRLAHLTGKHELEEKASEMFKVFGNSFQRAPRGYAFSLTALMFAQSRAKDIVIVGNADYNDTKEMLDIIRENFRPFTISLLYSDDTNELRTIAPFVENYRSIEGKPTAYVCENFTCQSPITDTGEFRDILAH